MRQSIYDAFEDTYSGESNDNLYPFIDHANESDCLDWLTKDIEGKFKSRQTRLEMLRRLDSMFKGASYTNNSVSDEDSDNYRRPSSIYNFICEMVEAKVAQRSRFKPAISIIPNNVDINDENRAESTKQILTGLAQMMDFESRLADGDKYNFLSGQSYTYVNWNKNIGGPSKQFEKYKAEGISMTYPDGSPIPYMMAGDIDIQVFGPDRVYEQYGKKRWCDVDDVSLIEWIHVDELKADHPEKDGDIVKTDTIYHSFFSTDERREWSNHCMVVTYYHKPTRFLPKGAYIKYVPGAILEKTDFPYKDGKLPFIFDTDIDVQGELTGRPFSANIEKLQRLHDMVSSSMARGFAIANSPKWVYSKGSIDQNKLTNDRSSLEFKGPIEPRLVSFNGVPTASMDLLAWTEKGIEKSSSVYGISRGEPPKGIKAAVALQFLDEQELQRESRGMAKRQKRIIDINKMVLSRVQQFYTPEDGRIIQMLGDDNQYLIMDLKTMNISGDFDIRIENSSSLPDSKTGKIAAILDLNTATQADPMFNKEAIAQMLDLGNDKRFKGQSLSGLKAGQFKLQGILKGESVPEPRDFDDFIVEYPLFISALRQREYKGEDETIMGKLSDYVMAMEYLMWKKAQMNPVFKQRIMMFSEYPIFYTVPLTPPMAMSEEPIAEAQGAVGAMPSNQAELQQQQQVMQQQPGV